ncbi:helix-turn-helix transcriptional regulator [Kitasatospora sp. NPDC088351]|uniref:helix-turn-helix transcriptional regulator n=1 Tax=unclassified Kitasatospora TaxID=2633591 RepID=UPI00343350C0
MATPKQNPTAWKYCGDQIKRWRAQAGVTRDELSTASNYDCESVRSMEAGRRKPSLKLLTVADELCNARGMLLGAYQYLASESPPTRTDSYRDAEDEAIAMYSYEPLYIPGLLQTEEYARAILSNTMPPVDDATVEDRVKARMLRQEKLTLRPTVLYSFVIYEAALHAGLGGPGTMQRQLHRLLETEQLRNVRVQILTIDRAIPSALSGSMVVIETVNHEHYVYVETHGTNALHSDPKVVSELSTRHAIIRAQALSVEDSMQFIRKVAEQL